MDHLLELFHSEHNYDLLDVDIQMLQDLLVVSPPSKFYTVSTMLFLKYGGEMLQSQIACHTFLCLNPPSPL